MFLHSYSPFPLFLYVLFYVLIGLLLHFFLNHYRFVTWYIISDSYIIVNLWKATIRIELKVIGYCEHNEQWWNCNTFCGSTYDRIVKKKNGGFNMSDLAATNCGCEDRGGCGCGCANNSGCGCDNSCGCNNGCGCNSGWGLSGGNNSCCNILWIIILMCCCGNNGYGNGCGCGNNDNCWIIVVLLLLCGNNGFGCGNGCGGCGCWSRPFNKLQSADKKQRIISSAFVCFFLPVALFPSAYFPFYA